MTESLLVVFLICGLANFFFSVMILRTLKAGGIRFGFYEMRWQVHKHLKTYKQVSTARTGRVGLPFYGYWSSLGGLILSGALLFLSLAR